MMTSQAVVHVPGSLAEALALRAAYPAALPLAGGTDVMVYLEAHQIDPPAFIDLWGVEGLCGVEETAAGLRIGAAVSFSALIEDARVVAAAPTLVEAARTVGARQIQNRGTLGGNIANASPAGDSMPVLLSLDAELELASAARGTRRVALADFYRGYKRVDLAGDELIVAVWLPRRDARDRVHFRKVGTRMAQSISKVVLGARVRVEGGVVTEARIGWGSVAATPVRSRAVEAALVGRAVDPGAAAKVRDDITPIDDVRSTAGYRLAVAERVLRRWLASIAG
ncbi:MAG: FAD binding domain-containing protein [Myxococcales bacterium]|nr:FAD binding domain-containing protein [Myxococcales bacterium]